MEYPRRIVKRPDTTGELRGSVRFPLKLPLAVKANQQEHQAETGDISSGGVMFYVDADLAVGSSIEFHIGMPATVLGTPTDVKVLCMGRVIRSAPEGGRHLVAAVIDEYCFQRS